MIAHARKIRLGTAARQWPAVLWLTLVWVLLWGDLSWANVLAGAALGIFVVVALPLPSIEYRGRVRPLALLRLLGFFARDLVTASAQVAVQALRLNWQPRGAVVRVPMRNAGDLYLTIASLLVSLVPGTVIVEAHRLTGTLYVHVLDLRSSGGADAVRAHVAEIEERVLRALASTDELEAAGLGPSPVEPGAPVESGAPVEPVETRAEPGTPVEPVETENPPEESR
ncbi:multisubunit sodium/proton antiporter, MrpE subunit [Paraoerskovia marina]|uniref:Multisubunit sodium/proton antiporter, MrpE subunit n=1 Tax=Paraoerskovia marina TaxID=545619 RepID=A0A1H1LW14_9CELL|nr:Na+/H+ antiporter subunit E [Paraoerskovia marina]SDR78703.1 multisubunit sodium/proton antiporter, MrpE subunit [Paraoerskovia marina]